MLVEAWNGGSVYPRIDRSGRTLAIASKSVSSWRSGSWRSSARAAMKQSVELRTVRPFRLQSK